MAYTTEYKLEILAYAKQCGVSAAAQMYNVTSASIILWNKKYKVYEPTKRRTFTEDEKIAILEFARDNGVNRASVTYHVIPHVICNWNREYNIYPPNQYGPGKRTRTFTKRQKVRILTFARDNGFTQASYKFQVPISMLWKWNTKYHVFPTTKYNILSEDKKIEIVKFAHEHSVSQAALKFNTNATSVRNWCIKYKNQVK